MTMPLTCDVNDCHPRINIRCFFTSCTVVYFVLYTIQYDILRNLYCRYGRGKKWLRMLDSSIGWRYLHLHMVLINSLAAILSLCIRILSFYQNLYFIIIIYPLFYILPYFISSLIVDHTLYVISYFIILYILSYILPYFISYLIFYHTLYLILYFILHYIILHILYYILP